jgi:hypothetical protein
VVVSVACRQHRLGCPFSPLPRGMRPAQAGDPTSPDMSMSIGNFRHNLVCARSAMLSVAVLSVPQASYDQTYRRRRTATYRLKGLRVHHGPLTHEMESESHGRRRRYLSVRDAVHAQERAVSTSGPTSRAHGVATLVLYLWGSGAAVGLTLWFRVVGIPVGAIGALLA